jgi:hypothetical protein
MSLSSPVSAFETSGVSSRRVRIEAQLAPIGSPKEDGMSTKGLSIAFAIAVGTGSGATLITGCAGGGTDGGNGLGAKSLIDDLEDGDDAIAKTDGRVGTWYTFHDATTGTQVPSEADFLPTAGGAGASMYAADTNGMGFTDWGAGMAFDLNDDTTRLAYDASKYKTLGFKAKGNVMIRVAIETAGVTATGDGGTCTDSTVMGMECEDVHGTDLMLSPDWTEYTIPFEQLTQEGWGLPVAFDAKTAMSVQFQVGANTTFDFAIDDVAFYQ